MYLCTGSMSLDDKLYDYSIVVLFGRTVSSSFHIANITMDVIIVDTDKQLLLVLAIALIEVDWYI